MVGLEHLMTPSCRSCRGEQRIAIGAREAGRTHCSWCWPTNCLNCTSTPTCRRDHEPVPPDHARGIYGFVVADDDRQLIGASARAITLITGRVVDVVEMMKTSTMRAATRLRGGHHQPVAGARPAACRRRPSDALFVLVVRLTAILSGSARKVEERRGAVGPPATRSPAIAGPIEALLAPGELVAADYASRPCPRVLQADVRRLAAAVDGARRQPPPASPRRLHPAGRERRR